jgi:hypothetical protein
VTWAFLMLIVTLATGRSRRTGTGQVELFSVRRTVR